MGIEQLATFATPPTDENCFYQLKQGFTFLAFSPPDGNLICTIYPTPSASSLQPWWNSYHGLEQKLKLSHHLKHFWPNSFREGAVLLFMEVENHCYYELCTCACPYSLLWERKMACVSSACQAEGTIWYVSSWGIQTKSPSLELRYLSPRGNSRFREFKNVFVK